MTPERAGESSDNQIIITVTYSYVSARPETCLSQDKTQTRNTFMAFLSFIWKDFWMLPRNHNNKKNDDEKCIRVLLASVKYKFCFISVSLKND